LPSSKYAFISAYLKGAEARLLTADHVGRFLRVSNIQDPASGVREVLEVIKDTEAGGYLDEAMPRTFDDADRYLWRYLDGCISRLENLKLMPADMRRVLQAYLVKYDIHNVKAAVQGVIVGRGPTLIPIGNINDQGLLAELNAAANNDDIIEIMLACRLGEYADILRDYATDSANARFMVEARLDSRYYERLLKVARAVPDGALLAKAFSIVIDMMNLSLISRALIRGMGSETAELVTGGGYLITAALAQELLGGKLADMPATFSGSQYHEMVEEMVNNYNRTHNMGTVDEVIDRHRFHLLRDMLSPWVLSPLVIGWYLLLKEIEVRDLRLILKVTFDGIPVEEIKEYLISA